MVSKCYLQYGIVTPRVVRIHGLPSAQLSRMINLTIRFAQNKCLSTILSTELIPIAWTYPKRLFPVTLQFDPHLDRGKFSLTQFRRLIACNAAVPDIPLH